MSELRPVGSQAADPVPMQLVRRRGCSILVDDQMADDLLEAAYSWPSPFIVSRKQIESKLNQAEEVALLQSDGNSFGFVSTTSIRQMSRTGFTARYVHGTIVHRSHGGAKKFQRLMDSLGERPDVEILHTQNPYMARALAARSGVVFPDPDGSMMLAPNFREDLNDLFRSISRPTRYCPITGIAKGLYESSLYRDWPIPGAEYTGSFRYLVKDSASAVVVIGFSCAEKSELGLVPTATTGVWS